MRSFARIERILLIGLLLIGLTACGKDDGNNGTADAGTDTSLTDTVEDVEDTSSDTTVDAEDTIDTGPETLPADEIDVALHETLCEATWECANRNTYQYLLMYYGRFDSVEACKAARPIPPSDILSGIPDIQAAIALDRIAYDAELGATCVDALYEGLCDIEEPLFPEQCEDSVFTGKIGSGEACKLDDECEPGLVCATSTECDGTCTPTMMVLCGGVDCSDDEYCEWDMCVPRKPAGESCNRSEECQNGLSCDGGSGSQICVENASVAAGESCSLTQVCEAGTFCRSGTCEVFEFVGDGETCRLMASPARYCNPGLVCHDVDSSGEGTCGAPRPEGEPCESHTQCRAELHCGEPNPGDPTECMARKADGETCSNSIQCESLYCDTTASECAAPDRCY